MRSRRLIHHLSTDGVCVQTVTITVSCLISSSALLLQRLSSSLMLSFPFVQESVSRRSSLPLIALFRHSYSTHLSSSSSSPILSLSPFAILHESRRVREREERSAVGSSHSVCLCKDTWRCRCWRRSCCWLPQQLSAAPQQSVRGCGSLSPSHHHQMTSVKQLCTGSAQPATHAASDLPSSFPPPFLPLYLFLLTLAPVICAIS